jgi:DNA modification methylase
MIQIDSEFKNLIPPLSSEERQGLESSLLKEGCRDALVLWGDILIDGHNRYEICTKHNIPFKTVQREFKSRDEVILWIIANQKSRRNLNAYARGVLEQKAIEILQKQAKEKQLATLKQNAAPRLCEITQTEQEPQKHIDVKKELAARIGTGEQTASRIMNINRHIEKAIEENKPIAGKKPEELKKELMKGDVSINQAYNAIKLEAKKEEIKQAEKRIAEQADDSMKPTIYIGDSTKYDPKEKYDLLLTDPPYSTDVENIGEFVDSWLYKALDNVKDTGFAYIFIGAYPEELAAYLSARIPNHIKLCQQLIWTYKNTLGNNPKDRYKQNYQSCLFYRGINAPDLDCPITNEQWAVQEINAPDGRQGDRYHSWQKPLTIAERFIRHSTQKKMTVYDPFACTGTFLIAAAKLGRKAYGFEISEDNARIAIERGCVLAKT